MPQLTVGPAPWPEGHCRSFNVMFLACVSPGLHLVEWTRHIEGTSYFVDAYAVNSCGFRLQVTSQLDLSKISVLHQ